MTQSSPSQKFRSIKLSPEELLYREGDVPHSMYLVKTGVISIYNQKKGKSVELLRIQSGHLIGELAFFNPEPRNASAKALVETELFEIPFKQVQQDFDAFPVWAKILLNTMSSQVLKFSRELKQFRSQNSENPEFFVPLFLRYTCIFTEGLQLFGETQGQARKLNLESLRPLCTFAHQVSPSRMEQVLQILKNRGYLVIYEEGGKKEALVESSEPLKGLIQNLMYYSGSHAELLQPTREEIEFAQAARSVAQECKPNPKGLVQVKASQIMAHLKAQSGKADMTTVDSLIQQSLPIQKVRGADEVEVLFHKEEFQSLAEVWGIIKEVAENNPFKNL